MDPSQKKKASLTIFHVWWLLAVPSGLCGGAVFGLVHVGYAGAVVGALAVSLSACWPAGYLGLSYSSFFLTASINDMPMPARKTGTDNITAPSDSSDHPPLARLRFLPQL